MWWEEVDSAGGDVNERKSGEVCIMSCLALPSHSKGKRDIISHPVTV